MLVGTGNSRHADGVQGRQGPAEIGERQLTLFQGQRRQHVGQRSARRSSDQHGRPSVSGGGELGPRED